MEKMGGWGSKIGIVKQKSPKSTLLADKGWYQKKKKKKAQASRFYSTASHHLYSYRTSEKEG